MINLSPKQLERLLTPVDVIRDPLHGDVRLTSLERFIIERPEFQRLGNINQLALTYLAYPGATHNRFIHSVGTLHVCSKMIETCNKNARMYRNLSKPNDAIPILIPPYCEMLARLCALCHDMAHVPFGHTLEKEGGIFECDEWQDPDRFGRIFGETSDFYQSVVSFLNDKDNQFGVDRETASTLLDTIGQILKTKKKPVNETTRKESVDELPFPFVHDLVGNTICADLIDYVQRDMFFCGLAERFGDRFVEYLAVLPTEVNENNNRYAADISKLRPRISRDTPTADEIVQAGGVGIYYRLVLLKYRYNEKHIAVEKHDVVAEGIDLVRKRLAVAEKLYYHRTKVAGSSMLIAAAYEAQLTADVIWDMSDSQVLEYLESSDFKRASKLAERIRTRRLFKPLFRASFHERDESAAGEALWNEKDGVYEKYSSPQKRAELIEKMERIIANKKFDGDLEKAKGTVTVSCPNKKMSLKAFDMLVLRGPSERVMKLQESVHRPTRKEIESIIETHESLWRLEVFVDPEVVKVTEPDLFALTLAAALQTEFGIANEVSDFRNQSPYTLDTLVDEGDVCSIVSALGVDVNQLTVGDFANLRQSTFTPPSKFAKFVKRELQRKGYVVSKVKSGQRRGKKRQSK